MALVAWGRRAQVSVKPACEPRWQRLRGGRGLHRIGRRGAIARNVAASVLTAALASGAGWLAAQHLTWEGVTGALPDPRAVSVAVLSWTQARAAEERPVAPLSDRADASSVAASTGARYGEPATDPLSLLDTASVSQIAQATDVSPAETPRAASTAAIQVTTVPTVHVVANGDTLSAIAARYDTTVAEIVRLNKLTDANKLTVGTTLQVRG